MFNWKMFFLQFLTDANDIHTDILSYLNDI